MLFNKMKKNIFKSILNINNGYLKVSFPDNSELFFGDSKSKLSGNIEIKNWGTLTQIFNS